MIYVVTLVRGVSWDDSAELAAGVSELGVVHSHGYSPYVLLGHLFTLVEPFGSQATEANLWSALVAAAAVALVARYVLVVTRSTAAAVVAGGLLALGPLFWYQATVASVYPSLAFAVALLLNAADAWQRNPTPRRLALLSFAIGLVALSHTLGPMFALGGVAFVALGWRRVRGARNVAALATVLVPLATLLYIPLRSDFRSFPNRGGASLWDMVFGPSGTLGGDTPLTTSAYGALSHSWSLVVLIVASLSPAALVLVPAGLRALWRERPYVVCCLLPALVDSVLVITVKGGYAYFHVPLVVAGAVACGAGLEPVRRAVRGSSVRLALTALLGAALLVAPVLGALFLANSAREASGWARATLTELPPRARLFAPWTAWAPLRAEQTLEGTRPDVGVFLSRTGLTPNFHHLRGSYAVIVVHEKPRFVPYGKPFGPVAGSNFKGLSGLRAGPFKIGIEQTQARTYYLPR